MECERLGKMEDKKWSDWLAMKSHWFGIASWGDEACRKSGRVANFRNPCKKHFERVAKLLAKLFSFGSNDIYTNL